MSEVEYDDSLEPYKIPDEGKLVAYAIKKVKLSNPGLKEGDAPNSAEFEVHACLLKGTYAKKKTSPQLTVQELFTSWNPFAQQGGSYEQWRQRYETGRGAYDDYNELRGYYDRYDRIQHGTASSDDFLDLSHYRDGIWSAISGGGLGWIADHHARQAEALAAATQVIDRLPGESTVDPTDTIGMPGNPGGQRAITSSRLFY